MSSAEDTDLIVNAINLLADMVALQTAAIEKQTEAIEFQSMVIGGADGNVHRYSAMKRFARLYRPEEYQRMVERETPPFPPPGGARS
jgi:hypothetical protein